MNEWTTTTVAAMAHDPKKKNVNMSEGKTANRLARKYLFEKLLNKTWTMRKIVNFMVLLDGCCLLLLLFLHLFVVCRTLYSFILCILMFHYRIVLFLCVVFAYLFFAPSLPRPAILFPSLFFALILLCMCVGNFMPFCARFCIFAFTLIVALWLFFHFTCNYTVISIHTL